MASIIREDEHLQRIETPEGTAVIISKFKSENIQVNIYQMKKGESFHLNPPGNSEAVKTYTLMSGTLEVVDRGQRLLPGDIVVLKSTNEVFPVTAIEETRLLVHSLNDNAFEKTAENFRYVYGLLMKIQDKDAYTLDHSNNVHDLVKWMAIEKGYRGQQFFNIIQAAKYHDIGKVYIPDAVLNKPGPLNDEEYLVMKDHVLNSKSLLEQFFVPQVFAIASQHHERLDGSGYPYGLKAIEIFEEAKIIAICDSYDAMTSNRVYKRAKTHAQALEELVSLSGTKYDKDLVNLFIACFEKYQTRGHNQT